MVSLYNHDYKKTSGFDLGINGWGLEDLKFAETLLNFKVSDITLGYSAIKYSKDKTLCHKSTNDNTNQNCTFFLVCI